MTWKLDSRKMSLSQYTLQTSQLNQDYKYLKSNIELFDQIKGAVTLLHHDARPESLAFSDY